MQRFRATSGRYGGAGARSREETPMNSIIYLVGLVVVVLAVLSLIGLA
jgi:hypothetical protein